MGRVLKVKKLSFAGHQVLEFADLQEFCATWDPQKETLLCGREVIHTGVDLEQRLASEEELAELLLIPAVSGG